MITDQWTEAQAYERYVGRWSRPVAREFVHWLQAEQDRRWLDLGCGTGALSRTILELARPRGVLGVDRSASYVAFAHDHVHDARARFLVGDALALPLKDAE